MESGHKSQGIVLHQKVEELHLMVTKVTCYAYKLVANLEWQGGHRQDSIEIKKTWISQQQMKSSTL